MSVSDTGCGISPKDLKTIAEPFTQFNAYQTRPNKGTGLGLYIVDRLMKLHDGAMKIASEVNVGTTVVLEFPAERVAGCGIGS